MNNTSNKIQTKWGIATLGRDGYYYITSKKEGYFHNKLHRLIWEDWYDKPIPKGYVIHHLNMDKTDNRIQNLQCVKSETHRKFHRLGKYATDETLLKMSKHQNTTGYFRVIKMKTNNCKQGFIWQYCYYENGKRKRISRTDLGKLKDEVKNKGLKWVKL